MSFAGRGGEATPSENVICAQGAWWRKGGRFFRYGRLPIRGDASRGPGQGASERGAHECQTQLSIYPRRWHAPDAEKLKVPGFHLYEKTHASFSPRVFSDNELKS